MTKHVIPRFKLILYYDPTTPESETYYEFVMNEMVPALQEMGLYLFRAFHTIPGETGENHPVRQVEYVAEELETIQSILTSEKWTELEGKLLGHVINYSHKTVRFKQGFQM
jgi:hypothetical protein